MANGRQAKKHPATAYQLRKDPIVLKQLLVDCGISQGEIGKAVELSRTAINLVLNHGGYLPPTVPKFKEIAEKLVRENRKSGPWLAKHGLQLADIWKPLGRALTNAMPANLGERTMAGMKHKAVVMGDPTAIVINWEVEMLTENAKRHFKLFKNPFIHDVLNEDDIFKSDEHRYIEAAMIDAAKHAGFLAVIGEVQSGKSVMRRHVIAQLHKEDNVRIIYPQIIDKRRATASSLCDAIVSDISSERIKTKLEDKSRQVHRLLLNRHKQGQRHAVIIEEAHDLPLDVLKLLKRFYELEHGYEKLLGIILIGQPELRDKLDEGMHPDMREVIRRIQVAEIKGLNGHIKDYLAFKLKRVAGGEILTKIFSDGALKALGSRLMTKDVRTGKPISHAYPGLVNNYAAKAMNLAAELGEPVVSEQLVMEI